MRSLFVIAVLCAPSLVSLVHADAPRDAAGMHTDDCAKARKQNKTCVLDMGKPDDITADRPTNDEIRVDIVDIGKAKSLMHIRRDFIVEILRTAEDL